MKFTHYWKYKDQIIVSKVYGLKPMLTKTLGSKNYFVLIIIIIIIW